MAEHLVYIPKATDVSIVEFFQHLANDFQLTNANVAISGLDSPIPVATPEAQSLKSENRYSIRTGHASRQNFSIGFERTNDGTRFSSPDRIRLNNSGGMTMSEVMRLDGLIADIFFKHADIVSKDGSSSFDEAVSMHMQMVAKLEENLQRLSTKFADERLKIQSEQDDFIRAKQKEFSDLEIKLRKDFLDQKGQLDAREKALDDRTNMHARRGIRQDIKNRLQSYDSNFSLTTNTRRMRLSIHAVILCSLLLLIAVILYYTVQFDKAQDAYLQAAAIQRRLGNLQPTQGIEPYILLAKAAIATIFTAALLAWYIRWMNRWFDRHADAEFNLKQFELDVDRASWVVETAMEWKTSQNGAIPENLLEGISKNLFLRTEVQSDERLHPADYLASAIFGSAASAKFSIAGNEIQFDRKSLKQLEKD